MNKHNKPSKLGLLNLAFILITFFAVLITVFPVKNILGQQGTSTAAKIKLLFMLDYDGAPTKLRYLPVSPQTAPWNLEIETADYFELDIDFLKSLERYKAVMHPIVIESQYRENAFEDEIVLCFLPTSKIPNSDDPPWVILKCKKNKQFVVESGKKWITLCETSQKEDDNSSFFRIKQAYAADSGQNHKTRPGWVVPSLNTLMTEKKFGFTHLTVWSKKPLYIENADKVIFSIIVNGTPIYIDGFRPEYLAKPFDPNAAIRFEFGLENLGFSGAKRGFEEVEVQMRFIRGEKTIREVSCPLRYVALRSFSQRKVITKEGFELYWQADYKRAKQTEYEVFIGSPTDPGAAEGIKSSIDEGAHLYQNNQEVVAVIRPPLKPSKYYGVVVGLVQPTGQIRFTFFYKEALNLLKWVKSMHSVNQVFPRDAFLYKLKG